MKYVRACPNRFTLFLSEDAVGLYQNSGLLLVKFFNLTILTYQLFTEMNECVLRDFFQASDECPLLCYEKIFLTMLFISLNNVNEELHACVIASQA